MLRSYLTIAFRTLKRRPGITAINITGLSAGLAVCLLITFWVQRELSYDDFHPEADRIHRIAIEARIMDATTRTPAVPAPLGAALRSDVAPVEAVTQFRPDRVAFRHQNRTLFERQILVADSSFFDVFGGFKLLHGSRKAALDDPDAMVLTETAARNIFGRTKVVGATLRVDDTTRRVTGVLADVPETSHLQFAAVTARQGMRPVFEGNWTAYAFLTYLKLRQGTTAATLQAQLDGIADNRARADVQERFGEPSGNFVYRFFPEPMSQIHLYSELWTMGSGGSIGTVYTFSLIGLFILLIACINFMNLATARATERATEVGMRKALGAGRQRLMGQFLGEAMLTTALATVAAFLIAGAALPLFNALAGTSMTWTHLLQPGVLFGGFALVLLVGLVSGSYPAIVLSRFSPSTVLKASDRHATGGQGRRLRQGLVVFQFAISIALIVGTLVAQEQVDYIQSKRLGLEKERVVEIERTRDLGSRQAAFTDRVRRLPGVTAASAGDGLFGSTSETAFVPFGADWAEAQTLNYYQVGHGFIETMGIEVVEGRAFDRARPADSNAVVLNRAAVERYGWDDPIGQRIASCDSGCTFTVIGVVDDFHYASMHDRVKPLALLMEHPLASEEDRPTSIYARLAPGQTREAFDHIQSAWSTISGEAFQYSFLDQTYDALHRDVQRTGRLFSLFAGLAVLIACLGLFGLATYTVQRRAKEIAIRKTFGATARQLVSLLSKDFLKLVAVGFAVATPVAWLAMRRWLEDFAYRITLSPLLFVAAGLVALVVAMAATGAQAFHAAHANPATTLRDK